MQQKCIRARSPRSETSGLGEVEAHFCGPGSTNWTPIAQEWVVHNFLDAFKIEPVFARHDLRIFRFLVADRAEGGGG